MNSDPKSQYYSDIPNTKNNGKGKKNEIDKKGV